MKFTPENYRIADKAQQPFIDPEEIWTYINNGESSEERVLGIITKSLNKQRLSLEEVAVLVNTTDPVGRLGHLSAEVRLVVASTGDHEIGGAELGAHQHRRDKNVICVGRHAVGNFEKTGGDIRDNRRPVDEMRVEPTGVAAHQPTRDMDS